MFQTWPLLQLVAGLRKNDNAGQVSLLTGDVNGDFSAIVQKLRDQISSSANRLMDDSGTLLTNMQGFPQIQRQLQSFFNPQPTEQVAAADEQMSIGIGAPSRRAYGGGRL